jgi:hypothetical protein
VILYLKIILVFYFIFLKVWIFLFIKDIHFKNKCDLLYNIFAF